MGTSILLTLVLIMWWTKMKAREMQRGDNERVGVTPCEGRAGDWIRYMCNKKRCDTEWILSSSMGHTLCGGRG